MERASIVRDLSQIKALIERFKQQPRPGQRAVLKELVKPCRKLNIKLPTGYGKTFTCLSAYSILKSFGEVNRLLVIFPTDAQLIQFEESAPKSMMKCSISDPLAVCDVRFYGAEAIKRHMTNTCQVFGITVQSLIGSRGMDNISTLLQKGRWMVVVDEYHHYGIDLPFGKAVNALQNEFLLCMSATPNRPNEDSAFGLPDVSITYREAVGQNAVKPLVGHSYHYRIDAINEDNEVISMTTEDLIAEVGSDSPSAIEKYIYGKKLRLSPKYISPLVCTPLSRMISERIKTGYRLQAIVGAMCVSHAEMVCEQIRSLFPDLKTDWVGTGDDGRSIETNRDILKKFAPTNGDEHSLDVLVHVGMAGEGLDTVYVSEVIHLNAASVNNTNNQENGRAARYLPGVIGHINFDAGTGYAKRGYVGHKIMDAMDNQPPSDDEDDLPDADRNANNRDEFYELPPSPCIRILDAECISIDSGDVEVQHMAEQLVKLVKEYTKEDLLNKQSDLWEQAINGVKLMRSREAEVHNERASILQWEDAVKNAMTTITGNVIRVLTKSGIRIDKAIAGDIKKRINTKKKFDLGSAEKSVRSLQQHYNWLTQLNEVIQKEGVPLWLR